VPAAVPDVTITVPQLELPEQFAGPLTVAPLIGE